jgi:hypothetical protein
MAVVIGLQRFYLARSRGTRVGAGKLADVVLLDANPRGDIRNVRRQAGVMARGRWMPRAGIDSKLKEIAATP